MAKSVIGALISLAGVQVIAVWQSPVTTAAQKALVSVMFGASCWLCGIRFDEEEANDG